MDFKNTLIILLLSFSAISCTRLSIGFRIAQYYIPSKIDDYIDATDSQNKIIEQQNSIFLTKIRSDVLPDLRKSVVLLQNDLVNDKLSVEQVHLYQSIFRDLFKKALHYTQPGINDLCKSLTQEQFVFLAEKLKKDIGESREKLDSGKRFDKLKETWQDNLDKFIGKLDEKQTSLLNERLLIIKEFLPHELKGRETTLVELQNHIKDKEYICKWFDNWSKDFDSIRTPEYKSAQSKYHRDISDLLYQLLLSLSTKQKESLSTELLNLVEEIKKAENP